MPDVQLLKDTITALSDALLVQRAAIAVVLSDDAGHRVERHQHLVNELDALMRAPGGGIDSQRQRLKFLCIHPESYRRGDGGSLTGKQAVDGVLLGRP